MPKNANAGDYFIGSLEMGHPKISVIGKNVKYPVRYTVLEWSKRHGTDLSTVVIEKKKPLNFGEKELSGIF